MGHMSLRIVRRVFMQGPAEDTKKTKIDLRRRIRREVHPTNKAGENFNLENHRKVKGYTEVKADRGLSSRILTLPTNIC